MSPPKPTYPAANDPWLFLPRPNPAAEMRLFCFPFAGGSAMIYRDWAGGLPEFVEVCAVQLPGRGRRLKEPPFRRHEALIPEMMSALMQYLDKPFAFFGHSMGAILAFELSRRLRAASVAGPVDLFVSGSRAPQLPHRLPTSYDLPEPAFIEELRQLNGTPQEVLDHPELMQVLIPLLRADFELVQTYAYGEEPPLACPITAFGGRDDGEVPLQDLEGWRAQAGAGFSMHVLPGDHFFLLTATQTLLRIIFETLQRVARGGGRPPRASAL
jgi:medium-chain acyl-[acyl-carrier-protein] hydrolase